MWKRRRAHNERRRGEAARLTIVGGRPPGDCVRTDLPKGIEETLARATIDPRFRRRLFADRAGALDALGDLVTPVERQILLSVPEVQLAGMIREIGPPLQSRRTLLARLAGALGLAACAVWAASSGSGCARAVRSQTTDMPDNWLPQNTKGIRPDDPRGRRSRSISPEEYGKTTGLSADEPRERGETGEGTKEDAIMGIRTDVPPRRRY